MTADNFRGLIMAICGVTIFVYSLTIDGFISFSLAFGGGLMTREGYDWWMDRIQNTPERKEQSGKSDV